MRAVTHLSSDTSWESVQVTADYLPVVVFSDLLAGSSSQLGPAAGLGNVAGQGARAGEGFVGKGKIEVGDAFALADIEHLLRVEQGSFGPPENRVDPGALPFPRARLTGSPMIIQW